MILFIFLLKKGFKIRDAVYTIIAEQKRVPAIERRLTHMRYVCEVCGYVYDEAIGDPDNGIAPGTKFEDLPEDFECPLCSVGKDQFSEEA